MKKYSLYESKYKFSKSDCKLNMYMNYELNMKSNLRGFFISTFFMFNLQIGHSY